METGSPGGLGRRSDRWAGKRSGRWATSALVCAMLGLAAATVIAAATAGASFLDGLPDDVGYLLYGAVPCFGVLALVLGSVGAKRSRRPWVGGAAMVVGSLEILGAIVAIVVLVSATRSL